MSVPLGDIEFRSISRFFGLKNFRALDDVSLRFQPGLIHAILGENGAGKSTLMKVLFGLLKPSDGTLLFNGEVINLSSPQDAIRLGFGMVQQHFSLVGTLSVIDNIMIGNEETNRWGGLRRDAVIGQLEKKISDPELALDWTRLVDDLSVGEKQRVEILKLISRDAKVLILDEPTAVLSPSEAESLFRILKKLKAQGRTVFIITHKLGEVFDHCDTWTVLRAGRAVKSGVIRDATKQEIVSAMVGAEVGEKVFQPLPDSSPKRIPLAGALLCLKIENLNAQTAHTRLKDFNLEIQQGETVGIAGVDGSGQAELVNSIIGLMPFQGNLFCLGTHIDGAMNETQLARVRRQLYREGLGLISEDRHQQGLWLSQPVWLNMNLGYQTANWLDSEAWKKNARTYTAEYDVRFSDIDSPVRELSGGNQQKLIFSREMLSRPLKLLVAHQPTRGVDLGAVRLIHHKIERARNDGAAVLLISSELDELFALSDRVVVLSSGRNAGEFRPNSRGEYDRAAIGDAMILGEKKTL